MNLLSVRGSGVITARDSEKTGKPKESLLNGLPCHFADHVEVPRQLDFDTPTSGGVSKSFEVTGHTVEKSILGRLNQ